MSGLRQVSWSNSSLLINNKPFYFRGFGRHEDSNIRGKGADLPLFARDYNLIKWMGANSYRTSHYPYDDQLMDFADRNGIVIIDECPGVALDHFEAPLLAHHLAVMTELVARDKNHPSVVMWSVGNEPRSYRNQSGGQPSLVVTLVMTRGVQESTSSRWLATPASWTPRAPSPWSATRSGTR